MCIVISEGGAAVVIYIDPCAHANSLRVVHVSVCVETRTFCQSDHHVPPSPDLTLVVRDALKEAY